MELGVMSTDWRERPTQDPIERDSFLSVPEGTHEERADKKGENPEPLLDSRYTCRPEPRRWRRRAFLVHQNSCGMDQTAGYLHSSRCIGQRCAASRPMRNLLAR